jgi:large subunit ribosomal protein L16
MQQPKRTKFRKQHKGRIHGPAKAGTSLNFGAYGLKALEPERITAREIEAARRAITRHMKRAGRVWIRVFPDVPVSKKPAEVRMGSGKGAPEYWVAKIKPGRILFEVDGVDSATAKEAMRLGAAKLSIATKFIARLESDHDGEREELGRRFSRQVPGRTRRSARQAEEGAVQPALPTGERAAGEHGPRTRSAQEHRAH